MNLLSQGRRGLVLLSLAALSVVPAFATGTTEVSPSDALTVTDGRGKAVAIADTDRVVTLGSAVTEIVFALDRGSHIAGVDETSTYPPEAVAGIPVTGNVRAVSAEGVLSLEPTLVLASADVGPPEALAQIEGAGVPVVVVPEEDSIDGVKDRIDFVASILDAGENAAKLNASIDETVARTGELSASIPDAQRVRVLFVYARGLGTMLVSGSDTSADSVIRLAGGVNAIGDYSGYRPLTAEAVLAADPDVVLFLTSGLASIGGRAGLSGIPALAQTRAVRNGRIVDFDDVYLLGFGPRAAQAIDDLAMALYPEQQ